MNVRVAPGRILIPDIAVITNPGADLTVSDAVDVALVVEIVSPGSVPADRAIKPQLYAAAGIAHDVRVELGEGDPQALAHRLRDGRYREIAQPGARLCRREPFGIDVDLAALVSGRR